MTPGPRNPDQDLSPATADEAPRSTRRRGAALTRAIHLATLEELAETSLEELSFERVAARAGTGKAALYRRWSTPAQLVLAALADPDTGYNGRPPLPATGSLRGDLLAVLVAFARSLQEPRGRALRPLLTQRTRHPELFDEIHEVLVAPHQRLLLDILEAAAERGEAARAAVTPRIAAVGPRLVIVESMKSGTVPRAEVRALVDEVVLPLTSPGATRDEASGVDTATQ